MLRPFVQIPPAWAASAFSEQSTAPDTSLSPAPDYKPRTPDLPVQRAEINDPQDRIPSNRLGDLSAEEESDSNSNRFDLCARIAEQQSLCEYSSFLQFNSMPEWEQIASGVVEVSPPSKFLQPKGERYTGIEER